MINYSLTYKLDWWAIFKNEKRKAILDINN